MRLLRVFGLILLICSLLYLSACQTLTGMPPQAVVERAIAAQLAQTQQTLIEQLEPQTLQIPSFRLSQVKIDVRESLPSTDNPRYRVWGTYQAKVKLPSRQAKQNSVFTVYIEQEPATAKNSPDRWYLLWPQTGERILLSN